MARLCCFSPIQYVCTWYIKKNLCAYIRPRLLLITGPKAVNRKEAIGKKHGAVIDVAATCTLPTLRRTYDSW